MPFRTLRLADVELYSVAWIVSASPLLEATPMRPLGSRENVPIVSVAVPELPDVWISE